MALLKECENIFRGVCYKHGTPSGVHCEHLTLLRQFEIEFKEEYVFEFYD